MSPVIDCSKPAGRRKAIATAVEALKAGELVVFPTDTLYGVGADAFNLNAVSDLLAAKGRGREMPPPVLIADPATVAGLATDVPRYATALMEQFWPGALTIVLKAQPSLVWDLGDTNGTVAIRMPNDPLALAIVGDIGPMAVSSANRTGEANAESVLDAATQLGPAVSWYLDAGPVTKSVPSTIVDATGPEPVILREGALSAAKIDRVVQRVRAAEARELRQQQAAEKAAAKKAAAEARRALAAEKAAAKKAAAAEKEAARKAAAAKKLADEKLAAREAAAAKKAAEREAAAAKKVAAREAAILKKAAAQDKAAAKKAAAAGKSAAKKAAAKKASAKKAAAKKTAPTKDAVKKHTLKKDTDAKDASLQETADLPSKPRSSKAAKPRPSGKAAASTKAAQTSDQARDESAPRRSTKKTAKKSTAAKAAAVSPTRASGRGRASTKSATTSATTKATKKATKKAGAAKKRAGVTQVAADQPGVITETIETVTIETVTIEPAPAPTTAKAPRAPKKAAKKTAKPVTRPAIEPPPGSATASEAPAGSGRRMTRKAAARRASGTAAWVSSVQAKVPADRKAE